MKQCHIDKAKRVEAIPGIVRRTVAYNKDAMLCHFVMTKGAKIPLHNHRPTQIGYVVSGRVKFIGKAESDSFVVAAGDGYGFDPEIYHGAEALEDSVVIEVFNPARSEYQDF